MSTEELERRYGTFKPRPKGAPSVAPVHREFREFLKEFAYELEARLPDGRYKDKAMDHLEAVSVWSHKSIELDLVD